MTEFNILGGVIYSHPNTLIIEVSGKWGLVLTKPPELTLKDSGDFG